MRTIIAKENSGNQRLDFAVFSGDLLTGNNIENNATIYWSRMLEAVSEVSLPFATVFGNHDDAPYESPTTTSVETLLKSTTTKQQLLAYEQATYPTLSYSLLGNTEHGVSNYYILVFPHNDNIRPMFIIYCLDSNGGQNPEVLYPDETDWLKNASEEITSKYGPGIPAILFVHIPTPEYQQVFVPLRAPNTPCIGNIDVDGIAITQGDNNLVETIFSFNSTTSRTTPVIAVTVGHNHENDWICRYEKGDNHVYLGYGRHTGYGGYSDLPRGARIFNIKRNVKAPFGVDISTWVRMEDGRILNLFTYEWD